LFDFEGDGGEGDGFAEEEGDALEGETGLDTIRQGVVLMVGAGLLLVEGFGE